MNIKKICILGLVIMTIITSFYIYTKSHKKNSINKETSLTLFLADQTEEIAFDDQIAQVIKEKTGVNLKIITPTRGDKNEISMMIATGDYPDLIYAKTEISQLVDADALVDITEKMYNSKYLKELYGKNLVKLKYSLENPAIFTVGTYGIDDEILEDGGTMQIQIEVLKELGYPEIRTLEDYENAIKTYIEKYPTINGKKTIGISILASESKGINSISNTAGGVVGIPENGQWYIDDNTYEATNKYIMPEVKEYIKWLNKMYNEGLLDPESFTQTEEMYNAKLSSGVVLGGADPIWNYRDAMDNLRENNKSNRIFVPLPVTLNENYKVQNLRKTSYTGGWGISITKSCKNVDKAFEFLDWMASDEAQVLVNWGIEGVHYNIIDGKRVLTEEVLSQKSNTNYRKETGYGYYRYPFPMRSVGEKDSTGNPYSVNNRDMVVDKYSQEEKEALKAYDAEIWVDTFPQPEELGESEYGRIFEYNIDSNSDLYKIQKQVDEYMEGAVVKAILSKQSDFENIWREIQDNLYNMDIQKANEEMTKMVKDKIALWKSKNN